jgi:hypothetical protein
MIQRQHFVIRRLAEKESLAIKCGAFRFYYFAIAVRLKLPQVKNYVV